MESIKKKIALFYTYKAFQSVLFSFSIAVFYFKSRGIDLAGLLIFESIYSLGIVFLELPTGAISDLFGRKVTLHIANILRLVCHVGFIFCHSFSFFIIIHILYALCVSLYSGSDSALLHDIIDEDYKEGTDAEKAQVYNRCEGTSNMIYLLAMTISAFIGAYVSKYSLSYPYVLNSIFAVLSIPIFSMIPIRKITEQKERIPIKKFFSDTNSEIKSNSSLGFILVFAGFFFFVFRVAFFLGQDYLKQLNFDSFEAGAIISFATLCAALASKKAWKLHKNIGEEKLLLLIAAIFTFSPLFLGIFQNVWGVVALVILYIGRGFYIPTLRTSVLSRSSKNKKATFLSLVNWTGYLLFAFLAPIFGWISVHKGISNAFWLCFITSLIGLIAAIWLVERERGWTFKFFRKEERACKTI